MAGEAFDKDFGYLMPFIDRVAAAAGALPDAARREELSRLIEGEKARWIRIRELLSGAAGKPASVAAASPTSATQVDVKPEEPKAAAQFTVGSLRKKE